MQRSLSRALVTAGAIAVWIGCGGSGSSGLGSQASGSGSSGSPADMVPDATQSTTGGDVSGASHAGAMADGAPESGGGTPSDASMADVQSSDAESPDGEGPDGNAVTDGASQDSLAPEASVEAGSEAGGGARCDVNAQLQKDVMYGAACSVCVQLYCSSEYNACAAKANCTCMSSVLSCVAGSCLTSCFGADAGPVDAGAPDAPCTRGPDCKALATCCSSVDALNSTIGGFSAVVTQCNLELGSCSESICASTITTIDQEVGSKICTLPDGG